MTVKQIVEKKICISRYMSSRVARWR